MSEAQLCYGVHMTICSLLAETLPVLAGSQLRQQFLGGGRPGSQRWQLLPVTCQIWPSVTPPLVNSRNMLQNMETFLIPCLWDIIQ